MKIRLKSGTCSYVGSVRVGTGNFWKREGRLTAKVSLPEENFFLGVGDVFLAGELECRVLVLKGDVLLLDVPGLELEVKKKVSPPKEVRMLEEDFGPEDQVTCLFQAAPYDLGGVRMGMANFGQREGRLSASLRAGKQSTVVFVGDEFDIGISRFRLLKIQRTGAGTFWEAFVKEIGPAHDPVDLEVLAREREEAGRLRRERSQQVRDHTFEIPRGGYLELLEKLKELTPEILKRLTSDEMDFTVEQWESEMKSEMVRNVKEGDMGPNTVETNVAVTSHPEAQAFTKVTITRWNPESIASMMALADWSFGGERIWCSLHCEADGEAYQACVMGPRATLDFVKALLLE